MSEEPKISFGTKLAAQVIEAYANLNGLTRDECTALAISDTQCATLQEVLKTGPEGEVTQDKRAKLAASGFSLDFIKTLAGNDGKNALRNRVKWLASRAMLSCEEFDGSQGGGDSSSEEIRKYGADAQVALPTLIRILEYDCYGFHPAVNAAIISMGSNAVRELMDAALSNNNRVFRNRIVEVLVRMGVDIVPELFKGGYHNNDTELNFTSTIVRKMGMGAIHAASEIFRDDDYIFNDHPKVAQVLARSGVAAVPVLMRTLKQGGLSARTHAACLSRTCWTLTLRGGLSARTHAAWALGEMRLATKEIIAALTEALHDCAKCVRSSASQALGKMGPNAKDAVPALISLAEGENNKTTRCETDSLLQKDLLSRRYFLDYTYTLNEVRLFAIEALGNIGPNAKAAVPILIRFLRDGDIGTRHASATALGKIGKNARIALSHLEIMERNDPDPKCRQAAKEAREKIEAEIP